MKFKSLCFFSISLAFAVVVLGAYTRLSDAGLGCPDWPGCYGKILVSTHNDAKAWTEMVHRYFAGTLGLCIFALVFLGLRKKIHIYKLIFLGMLVIFQALLGMWTVTLKLLPIVVMSHLLGGMLIFATLCRLPQPSLNKTYYNPYLVVMIIVVIMQILLGGWVSSNYAGIACIGFPRCNGTWLPFLDFSNAFNIFSPIGVNYQGGNLESTARVTIQFIHRCGALLTALYLSFIAYKFYRPYKNIIKMIMFLLVLQVLLGIMNVIYLLPMVLAVMHNAIALLLLASCFILLDKESLQHAA